MVGPWLDKPYTFRVPRKTFGQMWVRCDVCRRYARLKLGGLLDIDYRKKIQRLTVALNNPKDRAEAAEAIRSLVDKITLRPGPNRGEIDATLHGELGTILGWMEAQAVGKAQKRDNPGACAAGVSVSVVAGERNQLYLLLQAAA